MKNTKLIALVAVLLVVAVVVSVVIATSNDKKVSSQLDQTVTEYESKIDQLNATIEKLNQGLIDANEALEQFKEAGVELQEWNEASVALPSMLEKLEATWDAFVESKIVYNEDGETVLVPFYHLYNYVVDEEGTRRSADFTTLRDEATLDLYRATTVDEMNTIIANFKADCEKVVNCIDALRNAVTEAEKNGVTYDDYANIKLATYLVSYVDADLYAEDEADEIADRLHDLYVDFRPVVVDSYKALAEALPTVEQVAPSHYEQIEKANEELDFVGTIYAELYGADAWTKFETLLYKANGKFTALGKAWSNHVSVDTRMAEVKLIEEAAKDVNETLAEAFDKDVLKDLGIEYGANLDTHTYVYTTVKGYITNWENTWSIITDTEDEDYNDELYNLVNRNVYAGYVADFEKEVAVLKEAADKFINAVADLKVTLEAEDAINAAYDLYDAAAELMAPSALDTILNYIDYEDEDGEMVEIIGVQDSYKTLTNVVYTYYLRLVDVVEALEDAANDCIIVCVVDHGVDADGNEIACDCDNIGELDATKLAALGQSFDADIIWILSVLELDETVFDADMLAIYKQARLADAIATAKANLETVNATYNNNALYTRKLAEIARVSTSYTFAVKLVCDCDPDELDDCTHNVYEMAIENDPETYLNDTFTVPVLTGLFVDAQAQ